MLMHTKRLKRPLTWIAMRTDRPLGLNPLDSFLQKK